MAVYDVTTNEKKAAPSLVAGGTLYADSPIGTILPYGGASAPSGWFLCDGTAVSRTTYSELFAVIGDSFGAGDGSTTFNLPDMRGKFAEGLASGDTLGESKSAGLPNITGGINGPELLSRGNGLPDFPITGAFTGTQYAKTTRNDDASDVYGAASITFDASKSNSIYGNSNTVQPPAVCVNYIIKAKMIGVPSDFLAKVDEAISEAIIVKKGTWSGSITLQKMGDSQTRDRFDIPITFDSPMPDANYTVVIESFEGRYVTVSSASKTTSGFHIEGANCDNVATSTVTRITWTAIRFPS